MTTSTRMESRTAATGRRGVLWSGWVIFASLMLVLVGTINVIAGLVALLRETYFAVADGSLVIFGFVVWGVILLCFGGILILAGLGLTTGSEWARALAITLALLNVVAHMAFLAAEPAWSIIAIAINVLVIFALTARWRDVQSRLDVTSVSGGNGQPIAGQEPQPPVAGQTH